MVSPMHVLQKAATMLTQKKGIQQTEHGMRGKEEKGKVNYGCELSNPISLKGLFIQCFHFPLTVVVTLRKGNKCNQKAFLSNLSQ